VHLVLPNDIDLTGLGT